MQQTPLDRLTAGVATAFAAAVLCVFPLYIDRFSNLGLVKFTGGFTLFLLFCLALGACAAIGARAPAGRWGCRRRDPTLWGLAAFVLATLLSTVLSLGPVSSTWGLGGYYGGLMLVLYTAAGYWALRSYAAPRDLDLLLLGVGGASSVVTVLYVLNIFNIDLIGAYADTAVYERAQFFSTLGQKDFNASYMAVVLPLVFYAFLSAKGPVRTALYALPALVGGLALAVVDSEGLTLGLAAAVLVLVCHKDFDTRKLRRLALIAAAFFGWAAWMHWMRATVYTQGGTSLLSKFGRPELALPGLALCLAVWALLARRARRGRLGTGPVRLWQLGRAVTAVGLAALAALVLLANFWPGFPSLGGLHDYLVFSDAWGTGRGTAWRIAWGAWADGDWQRKLFGVGPGMMHTAVAAWAGSELTPVMKTFYAAHNEYLEQLLTTGLVGLAAWAAFVAAHLRRGFAKWGRPGVAPVLLALCSYLVQAVVSIRVSIVFPLVMLLFALLAVLSAPAPAAAPPPKPRARRRKDPAPSAQPPRRAAYAAKVALGAVAAMAVSGAVAPLIFAFLY